MKVILRTEVENLGRFGDCVKVARGYARNYLIPRGLALEFTPGNQRQFDAEREGWLKKEAVRRENAEAVAAKISAVALSFTRKAGDEGKFFGSVTVHDIADSLAAQGFELEKKNIKLAEPIKSAGEFVVPVKVHTDIYADVKVTVERELSAEEVEAEAKAASAAAAAKAAAEEAAEATEAEEAAAEEEPQAE